MKALDMFPWRHVTPSRARRPGKRTIRLCGLSTGQLRIKSSNHPSSKDRQ